MPTHDDIPDRPAWVSVDLGRLRSNLRTLGARYGDADVLAVIKADAYGHGAAAVASVARREGVPIVGVAFLDEAVRLRHGGDSGAILVLGPSSPEEIESYRRWHVMPTLSSLEQIRFWSEGESSAASDPVEVHLKIDTGMARLGIPASELGAALDRLRSSRGVRLAGFCSHLADGETPASERNATQLGRFRAALEKLGPTELEGLAVHLAAGAAGLHLADTRFDLVRAGLAVYGYDASGEVESGALAPVMSVGCRLADVREVAKGSRVGYDGTWTADRASRIGVLPLGYADGYPRSLSNRGEALVDGGRVPIVGRISMDLTLVDLTDSPDARAGDEVILLGEQAGRRGSDRIDAVELASLCGTIPYEILCRFGGMRLPRRYVGPT